MRELLELGIVRRSGSPWASLALLVAKGDGTKQLCVNYRNLNRITILNTFPLPIIEELLDRLGKARYISTLDLLKGYHQVPIHADSVAKAAFISQGKWEYLCMPFGLMNAIVADLTEYAAAYIKDLIIFSETFGNHI